MPTHKVLIAESRYDSHDEEMTILHGIGADVVLERSDDPATIARLGADIDALIVNLAPITAKTIGAMTRCRCISRYGVGVDNVDVEAATARKIAVLHVRNYCNDDVSEHALALLLSCARKTALLDRHVRKGEWNVPGKTPIYRVAGKVLGLVGSGAIGRTLVKKASGLGLSDVLVYDPYLSAADVEKLGARKVELPDLLAEADYISVHAPLTDQTRHLIGKAELKAMKRSAILVNTSRGPLVDTEALADALEQGEIAAAGIDVFEQEPAPKDCRLFALENAVLTDHAGWYSEESQRDLQRSAARNVALLLSGEPPLYCVNPEALG
ncbi:MAG: C-terminal binding protein [Kiritimatiellae bacterium]|nr:C-terminal binding protein [Kiritimatiellia bacterium]